MSTRPQITVFTQKGCIHCEQAKATLRDAGMAFFATYDVDTDQRTADAATYFSGKSTVPQIFVGEYPIGGTNELAELWQTRRLRDIAHAVDPGAKLDVATHSSDELACGAEDVKFIEHIPPSDGTHSDDPEQWPLLHFYKNFMGFWPNTFVYLHHWPEVYKRFVYCQNMAVIQLGKDILGRPLGTAISYSTSNVHGCNYCQVHSAAAGGDISLRAIEQLRLARIGQRDEDNPFDEYWVSVADLAGMASLNTIPEHYLDRLQQLARHSEHNPDDFTTHLMAIALRVGSFGFLNVFNDLVGMDIEGGWAAAAKEHLDIDFGRHGVNEDGNPNNLSHDIPADGPTADQMIGKYIVEVGDVTTYATHHFGLVPTWMQSFPERIRPLHVAFYSEVMRQQDDSNLSTELKHLLAYVSHIEKGHTTLATTEAFIAHYVAEDRPRTLQRLQHSFAVASGRGGNIVLFTEAERAALRLAYLSAQIPLITPRRFVQPVIGQFDTKTCIELFVVCSIASLIQRFAAIIQPPRHQSVDAFVDEHGLSTDTLTMRFPIL